jgi:hypothetical protein
MFVQVRLMMQVMKMPELGVIACMSPAKVHSGMAIQAFFLSGIKSLHAAERGPAASVSVSR